MKSTFLVLLVLMGSFNLGIPFSSAEVSGLPANIPVNPDLSLTPGDVCQRGEAEEYRYPEKIPYCRRAVTHETKEAAFDRYDAKYKLKAKGYNRMQFKMDHYISLCMGGSNDISNLWPQHLKVSELTDKIEELLCLQLARGAIKQSVAIDTIRKVKANLETAKAVTDRLIKESQALGIQRAGTPDGF